MPQRFSGHGHIASKGSAIYPTHLSVIIQDGASLFPTTRIKQLVEADSDSEVALGAFVARS